MTWSDTPIDGQQSVAANKTPINNAFTYIANEMKADHFWDNANDNLDGHHQFVQMPKLEDAGNPDDPTIATDMDGVYYLKDKTATEAPELQIAEPFYFNNDGTNDQILQLGVRAMVTFRVSGSAIVQNSGNDWDYQHNVSAVVRNSEGLFTITFATALPTNRYIVVATPEATSTSSSGGMRITNIHNGGKLTTSVQVRVQRVTSSSSVTVADPSSLSIIVLGG